MINGQLYWQEIFFWVASLENKLYSGTNDGREMGQIGFNFNEGTNGGARPGPWGARPGRQ